MWDWRRYSIHYSSTNTKVQFVLRYTKEGGSSTDCLINHLKSEHRIHEGENHKTIPAQEEIQPQIVKKEISLFEAINKRGKITLKNCSVTIKPKSVEPERAFSTTGLFVTKLRNRLNDKSALWLSFVGIIDILEKLCLTSLTICGGTNNSNFTMILSFYRPKSHSFQNPKKTFFPGFFSQLPETRVLKFCPELETPLGPLRLLTAQ